MKELTNTQLLRQIQDLTDNHERKKTDILKMVKELDIIEKDYQKSMLFLKKRMGTGD